jgi:(2Fe-2S) ferredoxin
VLYKRSHRPQNGLFIPISVIAETKRTQLAFGSKQDKGVLLHRNDGTLCTQVSKDKAQHIRDELIRGGAKNFPWAPTPKSLGKSWFQQLSRTKVSKTRTSSTSTSTRT